MNCTPTPFLIPSLAVLSLSALPPCPQGWGLGSDLGLAIQVANVGPLAFGLWRQQQGRPASGPRAASGRGLHLAIALMMACSILASGLLAGFWDHTWRMGSRQRSGPLLLLTFLSGLADCTSTVTFYPFVGEFRLRFVSALLTGEALSGLLTAALTWIQSSWSNNPDAGSERFSTGTYFALMACLMLVSGLAFALLLRLPLAQRERRRRGGALSASPDTDADADMQSDSGAADGGSVESLPLQSTNTATPDAACAAPVCGPTPAAWRVWMQSERRVLVLLAWLSFVQNGMFPSILSYAALPFGNRCYLLAQTLSLALSPFAAAAVLFPRLAGPPWLKYVVGLAWSALAVFLLAVAMESPHPQLARRHSRTAGGVLVAAASVLAAVLITYNKTVMLAYLRRGRGRRGQRPLLSSSDALFYAGCVIQAASFAGALLFWLLVQYTSLFESPG